MRFIDRFMNLARADAHGVLDSLEDPGLVLKQCLREAENELLSDQSRRDELARLLEQLKHRRESLEKRLDSLEDEIRLAIAEDAEDLARFSIRRLLAAQRSRDGLHEELRAASQEHDGLATTLAVRDAQLADLRQQVELHLARERTADAGCASDAGGSTEPELGSVIRDEEIDLELLRRRSLAYAEEVTQ